jgi:hypothetical protein
VQDGINLENKGVPAVVISHNVFGKAALAQSVAMSLPELRVIIYDQSKGKPDDVEGALFAKQVVD